MKTTTTSPQFIAAGRAGGLEPYLDKDPAFKADILADIPENVLDLYRDKPAAQGGILYGLPPDSNCQMQYYRVDILEKAGLKPAETWDEAIEIAQELAEGGKKQMVGTTLKRGFWAGGVLHHPPALPRRRLVRQDGAGRLEADARHAKATRPSRC